MDLQRKIERLQKMQERLSRPPEMATVKFLADCPKKGPAEFKKGSTQELEAPSALHWVRRNLAEYVVEKRATKGAAAKAAPALRDVGPDAETMTRDPVAETTNAAPGAPRRK